jgi:sensor histidine kinase YesM
MNWHEFVFSEKKPQRYTRHIIFWLAWGIYFFATMSFLEPQTNAPPRQGYSIWSFPEFIHGLLILFIHILATYTVIYFFLPRYLLKAKYISLLVGIILLGFVMVQANRFVDTIVLPFLNGSADSDAIPYYTSIFSGLISAIKIIAVAAGIKLVKYWWLKQKEKERLEKEKIEAELELLKAEIHPGFLFSTLNNIYSFSLKGSAKAPEMLLKLSDILSYMLYDCNDREVALEKEIKMLKDYMGLEKIRYGDKLEMNIQVKGDTGNAKIAPLLLLRFIENSFKQCNSRMTAQAWINLEMQIDNGVLDMKLMNGKPLEMPVAEDGEEDNLSQAQRRLQLLYPGRHELNITEELEIMMVSLKVELAESQESSQLMKPRKTIEAVEA